MYTSAAGKSGEEAGEMCQVACLACGADLQLRAEHQFPASMHFDAGQRKSVSYSCADEAALELREEEKWGPFFDSLDSWGIHRVLTTMYCKACGARLGVVLHDGPAQNGTLGQMGFGPTQVVPRVKRYRFWSKRVIREPEAKAGLEGEKRPGVGRRPGSCCPWLTGPRSR